MSPRLGARLRHLLALVREALGPDAHELPDIARALKELEDSVNTDLPKWRDEGRKRPLSGKPRAYLDRDDPVVAKSIKRLKPSWPGPGVGS